MTDTTRSSEDNDPPVPKIRNLRSGLGDSDPDRYRRDTYPPSWDGPQRSSP